VIDQRGTSKEATMARSVRRPVGTGKTDLATALGIEAIKRGHHVAFFTSEPPP
jgi:RecG-like helicase